MPVTRHSEHPYLFRAGYAALILSLPLLMWLTGPGQEGRSIIPLAPLLHLATALLSVVLAAMIFFTGYSAMLSRRKGAVVWLGIAFFGVALLSALHLASHVEMTPNHWTDTPQTSLLFRLAAQGLTAFALLVYALLPSLSQVSQLRKRLAVAVMLTMVMALATLVISGTSHIPPLYASGSGATMLAQLLAGTCALLHVLTLLILWRRRSALAGECLMALVFAVALAGIAILVFMLSGSAEPHSAALVGQTYDVLSSLYLLHATHDEALSRPLQQLQKQQQRERITLNAAPDAVLWIDSQGCIQMANPAIATLSGYSPEELVGQSVGIFLPAHLRASHAESLRRFFVEPHERPMGTMNLKLQRSDGRMLPVDISLGHWASDGEQHAIAYIRDLSERKHFEDSLRYKATHDDLTGLPNRWLLRLQIDQAIARAARNQSMVALILLDLDNFKHVNDSFGHAAGDGLLIEASRRMRSAIRDTDLLARLGGDEFVVLLSDLNTPEEAVGVATKLQNMLQASYPVNDHHLYSSGSLGLAFYPNDAKDSETLLRYADVAMYQAKQAARGTYACYSQGMDVRVHEDMLLYNRIKEALLRDRFRLHYQPQIDTRTGRIVAVEALLRLHDSALGPLPPDRIIPVAEATGLMPALADWVLLTACSQISAWMAAGTPLRIAVNFSAQQFRWPDLCDKVSAVLQRTGASAQWLEIEITESMAMAQPQLAREQLESLVALGCSVALDDFGTGYSSLSYLKAFPVSKLKIDKSFMDGVPHDANDVTIARAIIAMARSLGMSIVAEGVEQDTQLAFLRDHGCDTYQGWLYAKALPASKVDELLMQQRAESLAC